MGPKSAKGGKQALARSQLRRHLLVLMVVITRQSQQKHCRDEYQKFNCPPHNFFLLAFSLNLRPMAIEQIILTAL
jgi:hypothetical protein